MSRRDSILLTSFSILSLALTGNAQIAAQLRQAGQILVEEDPFSNDAPQNPGFPANPGGEDGADPFSGNEGGNGDINFEQLRQLLEQSRKRQPPNPEQQKIRIIQQLRFDRSPGGILQAKMEDAKAPPPQQAAPNPPQPAPQPEQVNPPANAEGSPTPPEANAQPSPPTPDPAAQAKLQEEMARFQADAQRFRRDIVLSRWDRCQEFLKAQPENVAQQIWQIVLQSLNRPTQVSPPQDFQQVGNANYQERSFITATDTLAFASLSPQPPPPEAIQILASWIAMNGTPPKSFFETLEKGITHFGGQDPSCRERAARLLVDASLPAEASAFLPSPASAKEKKDPLTLNLVARHRVSLHQKDAKAAGKDALPTAWELSSLVLELPDTPQELRNEALSRALTLIPDLGDDTGRKWLETSFKDTKSQGVELLSSLGTFTTQIREIPTPRPRLEQLRLQQAAVRTLLANESFNPAPWSDIFTIYARQWLHEAGVTRTKDQSNARRMLQQYDDWGNPFYVRPNTAYQGEGTQPISSGEMLECQPDAKWLQAIDPTTRLQCLVASAHLHLKVKEENAALPLIAQIAESDPDEAKTLVREIISVWAENHNPNDQNDYRSRYFYFYGFNNQSGSIPLTRSKQERNLIELAKLIEGIRKLQLGESFHSEFANAFISCHSQAEVWRIDSVETVFGAADALDTRTIATLIAKMRTNLAGLWPDPRLQQAYKTKRKDRELQEQILQGYAAASTVLQKAIAKSGTQSPTETWRLTEQLAALNYEESNYRSSIAPDAAHTLTKRNCLDGLAATANAYIKTLPLENKDEESSAVFETWFYAALGSPILEALKSHHVGIPGEYPKIRAALDTIPAESRERIITAFAKTLNTRLANVGPDLKLRYLEGVAAILGDHKELADASEVLNYYRDLLTEIQLDASVDGHANVGHSHPFGLRVNLRHTREIEREAGGFQRYLQNQTTSPYAYNFGRPAEDYRDKFEKAARAVLEEHFEVVSLTFYSDKVESGTDPKFGWRYTPYAYFLLKPKGPQVDRIPPLKIDLDFNDTSGYVILPVTSAEIPINAATESPRPIRDLKLTMTLDDRSQKDKGSLFLEIKATGAGLIPPLESIIDPNLSGLETVATEDRGLRVTELDPSAEDLAPSADHEWRIELKPANNGPLPTSFTFPKLRAGLPLAAEEAILRQRYQDVDLLPVGEVVDLQAKAASPWKTALLIGGAAIAALLAFFLARRKDTSQDPTASELHPLPSHITVVSVLGYLRKRLETLKPDSEKRSALESEIASLEALHFGRQATSEDPTALETIARRWQSA